MTKIQKIQKGTEWKCPYHRAPNSQPLIPGATNMTHFFCIVLHKTFYFIYLYSIIYEYAIHIQMKIDIFVHGYM